MTVSGNENVWNSNLVDFLDPDPRGRPLFPGDFDGEGVFLCGDNLGGLGELGFLVAVGVETAFAVAFFRDLEFDEKNFL